MRRRLAAMTALVAGAATIIASVAIAVSEFPRGLGLLGCVAVAAACAWYGVLRRGSARVAGFSVVLALASIARGAAPDARQVASSAKTER